MSKLEVASIINNVILTIVAFHIILSTWVDHTQTPFGYFYIMTASLIFNASTALLPGRTSK
jgi:hypothetical protein